MHTKWNLKTVFISFKLQESLLGYFLIVSWFSKKALCKYFFKTFNTWWKPWISPPSYNCFTFCFVWTGYSQIKANHIYINYWTILKIFISSAVAIQKSHFLMQIQDMEQSSLFSGTIDCEAIQARYGADCQNSLCDQPITLKTT